MATYSDFEAKAMAVTFADLRAHGLYELAAACDASAPETLAAWERTAKEQKPSLLSTSQGHETTIRLDVWQKPLSTRRW